MKKGNMYKDWKTWNPLAGKCYHDCAYCASQKFRRFPVYQSKYTGEPRLDENAFKKNLGKNNNWFVSGVAQDLFADNVNPFLIYNVLTHIIRYYPDNNYLFQTKNPAGIDRCKAIFPVTSTFGITLETNRYYSYYMRSAPSPKERVLEFRKSIIVDDYSKQITIEPIMSFDLGIFVDMIKSINPDKVYIGANSFKRIKLPEPSKKEVLALISELEKFTRVHLKNNLNRIIK